MCWKVPSGQLVLNFGGNNALSLVWKWRYLLFRWTSLLLRMFTKCPFVSSRHWKKNPKSKINRISDLFSGLFESCGYCWNGKMRWFIWFKMYRWSFLLEKYKVKIRDMEPVSPELFPLEENYVTRNKRKCLFIHTKICQDLFLKCYVRTHEMTSWKYALVQHGEIPMPMLTAHLPSSKTAIGNEFVICWQ